MTRTRADRHNNPTAVTTDLARQAGLHLGVDYEIGDTFPGSSPSLITARILGGGSAGGGAGDPVPVTIRLIDKVGFQTKSGGPRWTYINLPDFVWVGLTVELKRKVIGWMYKHEGGTELLKYFT